jgi:hypothetical protein
VNREQNTQRGGFSDIACQTDGTNAVYDPSSMYIPVYAIICTHKRDSEGGRDRAANESSYASKGNELDVLTFRSSLRTSKLDDRLGNLYNAKRTPKEPQIVALYRTLW